MNGGIKKDEWIEGANTAIQKIGNGGWLATPLTIQMATTIPTLFFVLTNN